jgi:hypothetical protein
MTFLEALQAHKGGLVRIKSDLFWYGGRGWDGVHDRVCLLLDAAHAPTAYPGSSATGRSGARGGRPAVLLLVDGAPHWVWVGADDLELLQPGCNPEWAVV